MPILNFRTEGKDAAGNSVSTPEVLAKMGPIVPVVISVPDEVQRVLVERSEEPPNSVNGFALIDTGASATCFDIDAAEKVGLPKIGVAQMASATHKNHTVPTFAGKITTPMLTIDVETGMGANLSSQGNNMVAILGRDILRNAVFIYNGPDGHFSLSL